MKRSLQIWIYRISIVAVALAGCSKLEAQEVGDGPTLTIGSQAPALDIEHWLSDGKGRFKPVTKFEPGHIYVVEFWATWCGPCIDAMPHVVELQEKYADKNVQFIGVSDEVLPTVNEFFQKRIENDEHNPTYAELTSAYSLATDPDRSVYDSYMAAAGLSGIPNAFLIGKSGVIEWIGHPIKIDGPLQQVIDDQWDRNVYLAEFRAEQEGSYLRQKISNLIVSDKAEEALAFIAKKKIDAKNDPVMTEELEGLEFRVKINTIARKLDRQVDIDEIFTELDALASQSTSTQQAEIEIGKIQLLLSAVESDRKYVERVESSIACLIEKPDVDHKALSTYAWRIYASSREKADYPKELIEVATRASERCVKEVPDDPRMIATLAHLIYVQGDVERAIKLLNDAINKADPEEKKYFQEALDKLTATNKKSEDP